MCGRGTIIVALLPFPTTPTADRFSVVDPASVLTDATGMIRETLDCKFLNGDQ